MNNNSIFYRLLFLLIVTVFLSGCSGYFAYQEGLDLDAEGRYDESVASYIEAVQDNPDRLEYRMRLQKAREKAAYDAIVEAEELVAAGRFQEAIAAYAMAYAYDPSQQVAEQKRTELQERMRLQGLVDEGEQLFRERKIPQARQMANEVLKYDPEFAPGLELQRKVSAVHKTMVAGQELELNSSEPITLKFKKTDIKDAFSVISRLSGITFIYDEDIRSKTFTVFLEQATFAQAMELLLRLNQLEMKVLNPKTILIYPNTRDKKKQYEDQLVQIFYLSNIDAKKAVNLLRTMLTLRKVYVHEELNALVVRDTPVAINLARQMLEAADRSDSEVVFDLELISVSTTDDLNFGPQLSAYGASVGFAKPGATNILKDSLEAGGATVDLVTGLSNLQALYTIPTASFQLKKTSNDAEVLANPRVRVKNKEKAKVHVGTREPVITVTINGDQTSENIQYVDVGVKLDIEPVIQLDGTIVTKISLEVSDATALDELDSGTVPLRISTTNAQTVLSLKDGEQTVIGGLLRTSESKNRSGFPVISDIPLLGSLFTSIGNDETKQEILLSITPRIVRKLSLPSVELATIWSGGEEDLKDGPNFGSFAQRFASESEQRPVPAVPATPKPAQKVVPQPSPQTPAAILPEEEIPADADQPQIETIIDEAMPAAELPTEGTEAAVGEPQPAAPQPPALLPLPVAPAEKIVPPAAETLGEPIEEVKLPQLEIPVAATLPKLFFNGSALVDLDETFTLSADVSEIKGLYSAPMFVTYNPEVLEFVNAVEGDFLKQNGVSTIFTVSPNPSRGQLIVGYKQGVEGNGADGSGVLFKLQFKALKAGKGEVVFERVNLRDAVGSRINASTSSLSVEVR